LTFDCKYNKIDLENVLQHEINLDIKMPFNRPRRNEFSLSRSLLQKREISLSKVFFGRVVVVGGGEEEKIKETEKMSKKFQLNCHENSRKKTQQLSEARYAGGRERENRLMNF
jgi:hypothetical protein